MKYINIQCTRVVKYFYPNLLSPVEFYHANHFGEWYNDATAITPINGTNSATLTTSVIINHCTINVTTTISIN